MKYTVSMSLMYLPADDAAMSEFNKRWTPALKLKWSSFPVIAADKSVLASKLNSIIHSDCHVDIDADIGATTTGVLAFSGSSWTIGGGGVHTGSARISGIVNKFPEEWLFEANGKKYAMVAVASFTEDVVQLWQSLSSN